MAEAGAVGVDKINRAYAHKDDWGEGNCRRCDKQAFLNGRGYCSRDCELGYVKPPYQSNGK